MSPRRELWPEVPILVGPLGGPSRGSAGSGKNDADLLRILLKLRDLRGRQVEVSALRITFRYGLGVYKPIPEIL
jgi:hypothetical protein